MIPKSLRAILWLFVGVNIFTVVFYKEFKVIDTDPDVLLIANLYLCVLTFFSYWMLTRGLKSTSTIGFTSSVYGSFIIKLVLSALVIVVYSKWKGINTGAVLGSMFLYLVYMFLEVKSLMSFLRKK